MTRPRLLDAFCGAGGCSMGYFQAGFDVVGVDINPQPNYPFEFHQGDALEFIATRGHEFDVIHASPPCQKYGKTKYLAGDHPELIDSVRDILIATGKPHVIENVPGSPLINPTVLNGALFGMRIHRIRLFESSIPLPLVLLPQHPRPVKMGRPIQDGDILQPVGNFSGVDYARREMGINWMTGKELAQAIPPAYTEWIGAQLLQQLAIEQTSHIDKQNGNG